MGYELAPARKIRRLPYRVTFYAGGKKFSARFERFNQARGFRNNLPWNSQAEIEFMTLPVSAPATATPAPAAGQAQG